ncbi:MAG: PDZ domain-containing protein, partial [Candidatus Bipolaricaulia bacterium]
TLGKRTGQEKEGTNLNRYTAANYGLTLQENSPALTEKFDLSREKGLVVTEVTPGSRADDKLRKGDIILGVEHQTVNSIEGWKKAVKPLDRSEPLLLRVVRDGVATFIII